VTRGKGVRPFGEHVDDLVQVYFAEITSITRICGEPSRRAFGRIMRLIRDSHGITLVVWVAVRGHSTSTGGSKRGAD
jgi:hypothetical protein